MRPGMIFYRVTLLILLLNESRVGGGFRADDKEGGFHAVSLQKREDVRGKGEIRSIIKGQSNFREVRITTGERIS